MRRRLNSKITVLIGILVMYIAGIVITYASLPEAEHNEPFFVKSSSSLRVLADHPRAKDRILLLSKTISLTRTLYPCGAASNVRESREDEEMTISNCTLPSSIEDGFELEEEYSLIIYSQSGRLRDIFLSAYRAMLLPVARILVYAPSIIEETLSTDEDYGKRLLKWHSDESVPFTITKTLHPTVLEEIETKAVAFADADNGVLLRPDDVLTPLFEAWKTRPWMAPHEVSCSEESSPFIVDSRFLCLVSKELSFSELMYRMNAYSKAVISSVE